MTRDTKTVSLEHNADAAAVAAAAAAVPAMPPAAGPLGRLLCPIGGDQPRDDSPASVAREPQFLHRGTWNLFVTPASKRPDGEVLGDPFTLRDGTPLHVVRDATGTLHPPFDMDEAFQGYVAEAWTNASPNRRLTPSQLELFYRVRRFIPRSLQLRARRYLAGRQGSPSFPAWPIDTGVAQLLELYASTMMSARGISELPFRWFWPGAHRSAIVLSHDVESVEGIRRCVEFADLEEELGFRSSFNFGAWYDVDQGVLRELTSRGFEVGMHGITHDRSLFSSRSEFERQLPLLRDLAGRLGASGFRSPATHRVFDWLAELPVEYDCTIPHSDPYEPQPGGCCSLWPFFVGDVVELPYTLPQDHTLLTLLRHRSAAVWIDTARAIEDRFGLVQCITHPDPGYLGDAAKRGIYEEFLRAMAEREHMWRALPREVAAWWRRRDTGSPDIAYGRIEARSSALEASLMPPAAPSPI